MVQMFDLKKCFFYKTPSMVKNGYHWDKVFLSRPHVSGPISSWSETASAVTLLRHLGRFSGLTHSQDPLEHLQSFPKSFSRHWSSLRQSVSVVHCSSDFAWRSDVGFTAPAKLKWNASAKRHKGASRMSRIIFSCYLFSGFSFNLQCRWSLTFISLRLWSILTQVQQEPRINITDCDDIIFK